MRTFLPNEDTGLKKSSNFPKFTLSFEERKQDSEHNLPSPALLPTLPEAIHKSSQAGLLPKFLSPPGKTSHSYCKILFWISDALFSKVWSDHYRLTRESPPLPPDLFSCNPWRLCYDKTEWWHLKFPKYAKPSTMPPSFCSFPAAWNPSLLLHDSHILHD